MRRFFRLVSLVLGLAVFGDVATRITVKRVSSIRERRSKSPASSSPCRGATRMDRSCCP